MQNVAIVNTCDWGSTGKIAYNLHKSLKSRGYHSCFYYGRGKKSSSPDLYRIDTTIEVIVHHILSKLTGLQGDFSIFATKRLINVLEKKKVDTVFLVSAHGYYLNEKMFLSYIANKNIRLVYIMIDEYAYCGACCNEPVCQKIEAGKGKCPNIRKYPESLFLDNCSSVLKRKKDCYKALSNAVFVGPAFLRVSSSRSLLGRYMNTIDLDEAIDVSLYHPCQTSQLRCKLGIPKDKIVILCVAQSSRPHRGADFFIDAVRRMANDERFVFIHIGYQYKEIRDLPMNFISISFVEKDSELAEYYSMADVLVNPSVIDTMSNTCLEALACGTPLICFNISGMPYLMNNTVGKLVTPRDVDALVDAIKTTTHKSNEMIETCRAYALKRYDNRVYAEKLISIAEKGSY